MPFRFRACRVGLIQDLLLDGEVLCDKLRQWKGALVNEAVIELTTQLVRFYPSKAFYLSCDRLQPEKLSLTMIFYFKQKLIY